MASTSTTLLTEIKEFKEGLKDLGEAVSNLAKMVLAYYLQEEDRGEEDEEAAMFDQTSEQIFEEEEFYRRREKTIDSILKLKKKRRNGKKGSSGVGKQRRGKIQMRGKIEGMHGKFCLIKGETNNHRKNCYGTKKNVGKKYFFRDKG